MEHVVTAPVDGTVEPRSWCKAGDSVALDQPLAVIGAAPPGTDRTDEPASRAHDARPPSPDLPDRVESTRSAPATACKTNRPSSRSPSRPSSSNAWSPPGCKPSKPPASCPPSGCRSSATPRCSSRCCPDDHGVRFPVLVPNLAGLDRARAAGARHIAVFAAATETFSQRNLNRSLDEALEMFAPVVAQPARTACGSAATSRCASATPGKATVPVDQVVEVARRLVDQGCDEICIADTIGVATPGHVARSARRARPTPAWPLAELAVHFHDTYGQALANTLAALEAGVTTVDSSAGGLGGCPYAESATGNLATEDLVWLLHGLGIETGVDLDALGGHERLDGRAARPAQPVPGGQGPRTEARPRTDHERPALARARGAARHRRAVRPGRGGAP